MTFLLTNEELGLPENATPAQRTAALARAYEELGNLSQGGGNRSSSANTFAPRNLARARAQKAEGLIDAILNRPNEDPF